MTSEGTSDDLSLAKWAPEMPTVQEISESMQNFGTSDYTVFAGMLVVCSIVGIYFGFVNKSSGEDEYLVGGRNMKTFPVSLSLLASFISALSLCLSYLPDEKVRGIDVPVTWTIQVEST